MSNMNLDDCNCCEGLRTRVPAQIYNAPGLPAISYRAGTYDQFRQSMLVKLSAAGQPALSGLNTRSTDDFSIALLDSWAVVCDVLTFYQERIANESYKRTASEYFSVVQMARSASYSLRPGVAADTYLAFTLETTPGSPTRAVIDIDTKAQSLPNPGENPQVFETIEAIEARSSWNALSPIKTRSQPISIAMPSLLLQGTATNLHTSDVLLIVALGASGAQPPDRALRFVRNVSVNSVAQQTTVYLEDAVLVDIPVEGAGAAKHSGSPVPLPAPGGSGGQMQPLGAGDGAGGQMQPVGVAPGQAGPASLALSTPAAPASNGAKPAAAIPYSGSARPNALDNAKVDTVVRSKVWNERDLNAYATLQQWSWQNLLTSTAASYQNGAAAAADDTGVFVLRVHAPLFGNNAPDWNAMPPAVRDPYYNRYKQLHPDAPSESDFTDWPFLPPASPITVVGVGNPPQQPRNVIDLDRTYAQISGKSWVAVRHPAGNVVIARVESTRETGLANYTLSGRVTELTLDTPEQVAPLSMSDIRQTIVYGQSEQLTLALLPIGVPVQGNSIDVPGLYDGLTQGKMLMVTGELADLNGVQASEAVVLANTTFDGNYPGGLTTLVLKNELLNAYKPETVTISANIARATQGETVRDEVLGDGDASQTYQSFTLRQGPLTYLSDDNGNLVSTLQVFVNDLQWQEVKTLLGHGQRERVFVTSTGADGKTTVQFGDGQNGARLPNGRGNVRATYRKGSGTTGHVAANQITQLMTRPLGVKSVTNPLAPTGAEDPETTDEARDSLALTVLTLERLVSVADYENYARSFPGVAKALATLIASSRARGMFVTLAGTGGKEITPEDGLYGTIFYAMQRVGDPTFSLRLQSYRKALFRIGAQIWKESDAAEADVLQKVQMAVSSYFSFENRAFSQDVTHKEVINVIQNVPGVVNVGITALYRLDNGQEENTPELHEVLVAALPMVGADGAVSLAELLLVDTVPFETLEVMK